MSALSPLMTKKRLKKGATIYHKKATLAYTGFMLHSSP